VILEKTIIKLGSLLALGLGEAGANIVSENMKSSEGVNAMIPGKRVEAIIGQARVRDFSTATEVLQQKVMTFVNQIAEIVHGVVDEFHGSANKNNGDTFLLIWRDPNEGSETSKRFADMSVVALARILGAVHQSPTLAVYRGHPGLQQRLGSSCRVNLSFGLHYGWAIEGAVGSEFKIDASYLSPNVSIASSVEWATATYNVTILVTQVVIDLCNREIASKCRVIDKVMIKGSKIPLELYTIDLDFWSLKIVDNANRNFAWNARQRFKARQHIEASKNSKLRSDVAIVSAWNESSEIRVMRQRISTEFLQVFNMGYQNYSEGEWQVAKRLLRRTEIMLSGLDCRIGKDGPSTALLRYMEKTFNFEAPEDWIGIHDLVLNEPG